MSRGWTRSHAWVSALPGRQLDPGHPLGRRPHPLVQGRHPILRVDGDRDGGDAGPGRTQLHPERLHTGQLFAETAAESGHLLAVDRVVDALNGGVEPLLGECGV